MTISLRLTDELSTDTGCVRAANEDSSVALPRDRAWVVADGMGGHVNGKHASETIVQTVGAAVFPDDLEAACEALAESIHAANKALFDEATKAGILMGSTVVTLVIRQDRFAMLWAGDSRGYVFRDHVLHQLTTDHTQVQELVDRGILTPDQAIDHPMSHVLARAVGVQETLELDAISDQIEPGDIFLLCSDGLHGVLNDPEIAAIVEQHGSASPNVLVAACIDRGAPDNVTVAAVHASEPTAVAFAMSGEQS